MERIGIAASKIAKGNLHLYNFYVVLLTLLFSFLVYFLTGSAIVFALVLIAIIMNKGIMPDLNEGWFPIMWV